MSYRELAKNTVIRGGTHERVHSKIWVSDHGGIERFRPLGVSGNAAADFVSVWDVGYLWAKQVPLTEFGKHVNEIILRVKEAALRCIERAGRPVRYLASAKDDKEASARAIGSEQKITAGPVGF